MMTFLQNHIYHIASFGLVLTGLYIIMARKNLIKVILGISILETGVNVFLISLGYRKGGTAPIFSRTGLNPGKMTDPVPQALVLTAIVIGLAVLALALTLAIRAYKHFGTLNLEKMTDQKW